MKHYAEAGFGARREQVELESFSSMKTPVVWISPCFSDMDFTRKLFILFDSGLGGVRTDA